jgi:hypothetical protein
MMSSSRPCLPDAGPQRAADHAHARVAALFDQHLRPRLGDAEQAAGECVAEADFRLFDDVGRKIGEPQPRRV